MSMNYKLKKDETMSVSMGRRLRSVSVVTGKGVTEQAHKNACDVNLILKRYKQTGQLPPTKQGQYVDVSRIGDFQHSMNIVAQGKNAFEKLPAEVRKKFKNDPVAYVEAMHKESYAIGQEKIRKMEENEKNKSVPPEKDVVPKTE